VPMAPENKDDPNNPTTWVVSFPVKAPEGARTNAKYGAVEQCKWWYENKTRWTEHNRSVTITYKPSEILDLLNWLWYNRMQISGMSFLPYNDIRYDQMPNVPITEAEYNELKAKLPTKIAWERIYLYEKSDHSQATSLPQCDGPICELPE